MQPRWLSHIRAAGEPDLGVALVRLAHRAAEIHRRELFEAGGVTAATFEGMTARERQALLCDEDHSRSYLTRPELLA